MNIGINCFNINPNYGGGINTYTIGLLEGFTNRGRDHNFQIYVNNRNSHLFTRFNQVEHFNLIELPYQPLKKFLRKIGFATFNRNIYKFVCDKLYNNVTEVIDSNSDLVYTPTTILFPFNFKKPTIVSMHDIQQFHFPEFFTKRELLNRKIHFKLSTELSNFFQASSQFIKEDLLRHFKNIKEEQIIVINEGVNIEEFSSRKDTSFLSDKYKIPEEFLFFPAQLWHHKNHITVLKALKKIENEFGYKINLVLTGAKESAEEQIFEFIKYNEMDYVHYLGLVPFADLLSLYQKAKFLITAVLYESSSLPILEAAVSGTPIIASKTPPNVEMSRMLKLNLFEPTNVNELSSLIKKIWNDNDLINQQTDYNREHINYYSWDNVASKYLNFFERILGK